MILQDLYLQRFGHEPKAIVRLSSEGGNRQYFRIMGDPTVIGTVGDSLIDCRSFISLSRMFRHHGVRVPEVFIASPDYMKYLQQDLGDISLFRILPTRFSDPSVSEFIRMTMDALALMHSFDYDVWKDSVEYKPFSPRQVKWDLNYFKYEYLKPLNIPFDEELLEDDFDRLSDILAGKSADRPVQGFMMRDCQSRNVMIHDSMPYFIDFQSGRLGPVIYDVVSFLWQAKANFTDEERLEYINVYINSLRRYRPDINDLAIRRDINNFALFRTLQVLGAYGFRGLVEHRAHFIESISGALKNLSNLIDTELLDVCPELKRVCEYCISHNPLPLQHDGLHIEVVSFSYKRGYPENLTGNGGGFMFDCRGMHNPGRYDEYKPLTGLDQQVINFLEERGEVQKFVAVAIKMVSPAVECYLRRNFHDLQIGFGCTGGRHRSVYCAEAVGRALHQCFPAATIRIVHREQNITTTLYPCKQ